jgi:uncharacterized protein YeaO (DUF488 family)
VDIHLKRVYAEPSPDDGRRVLVDRLWPRGISRERAELALWAKDVAPSTELRQWYTHDPEKFDEFERRYRAELEHDPASSALEELVNTVNGDTVTLLTSTREVEISHLAVLAKVIPERLRSDRGGA